MKHTFLLLVALALAGCTDSDGARRTLAAQGYSNITITGYRFGAGGEGDTYVTGFEATSPAGVRVSGAVCRGWLKGSTIRLD